MNGKTETALRIIAGLRPAWVHWKLFMNDEPPKRDKSLQTAAKYQDDLSVQVRLAACKHVTECLNRALPS